ncbi:MAG: hypothetical protein IKG40_00085 [Bacilli bacterium]|nr:hypothetical protein [Bacilli bacterium]
MDNRIYLINLYDYYSELLTEKQREYFEDYYFDNLSLTEISENDNISRNAIHKQLKDTIVKLENYENKLKLYQKGIQIKELIKNLDNKTKEKIEELI